MRGDPQGHLRLSLYIAMAFAALKTAGKERAIKAPGRWQPGSQDSL